jgi:hypothetical protein
LRANNLRFCAATGWQTRITRLRTAIVKIAEHVNPIAGRFIQPDRPNAFGADVLKVISVSRDEPLRRQPRQMLVKLIHPFVTPG